MSYFVISKTYLDFEGYPKNSEVMDVKETKDEAEQLIENYPNLTIWVHMYPIRSIN